MQDAETVIDMSLVGLDDTDWKQALEEIGDDLGMYQPLGDAHFATFIDQGKTLLVTFETMEDIRKLSKTERPLGFELVKSQGWSHLCVISDGETWFRGNRIYGFFDRLIDDGFFEDFDNVVFFGAGSGAYAAAAYSVAAPGATVLAIQPQATLDPRMTDWDPRFPEMRRTSFSDRYGYAPDMLDAADQAFVFYDPREDLDAMHATLFERENVARLRMAHMGDALLDEMITMGILFPLIELAGNGELSDQAFHDLYRARRSHASYLRNLMARLDAENRPYLNVLLCRNATARLRAPRLRRRLDGLLKQAATGEFRAPPAAKTAADAAGA